MRFWKAKKCAKSGKQTNVVREQEGILSAKKPCPSQRVFVDCFDCSTQGRRFEGQGANNRRCDARVASEAKSLSGGCIFADAVSALQNKSLRFQFFCVRHLCLCMQFLSNADTSTFEITQTSLVVTNKKKNLLTSCGAQPIDVGPNFSRHAHCC